MERRFLMFGNGPSAAEVVLLLPSAAAVIYLIVALHLIDTARRQRSFEREDDWLWLAIGWPWWLMAGAAALTLVALNRVVNRRLVEGGRS
jgi:hypothetical protein